MQNVDTPWLKDDMSYVAISNDYWDNPEANDELGKELKDTFQEVRKMSLLVINIGLFLTKKENDEGVIHFEMCGLHHGNSGSFNFNLKPQCTKPSIIFINKSAPGV